MKRQNSCGKINEPQMCTLFKTGLDQIEVYSCDYCKNNNGNGIEKL